MNEEIIGAYDAFSSGDNDLIRQADEFFKFQIMNNPTLYAELFEIINNSSNLNYKKLSLILIKELIIKNFSVVNQNFEQFSKQLHSSIINTNDKNIFLLMAEIVYQIILIYDNVWEDLQGYLILYQDQIDFLPFCIYLYSSIYDNQDKLSKYKTIIDELNEEIILRGLLSQDLSIQISSIFIFAKTIKEFKEESDLGPYQEHYSLIYQMAENSINMDKDDFLSFWSQLIRINYIFSSPLFKIAQNFLGIEGLNPDMRMKLLHFVIHNYRLINQEDLEPIINEFFNVQLLVDDVDKSGQIFYCLSFVERQSSYELFRDNILKLLSTDDSNLHSIGLTMALGFVLIYNNEIVNDISTFIDLFLNIAANNTENIDSILDFLYSFLGMCDLESENTDKINAFLVELLSNQLQTTTHYKVYLIYQIILENSIIFDTLVEIYEKVQLQSLSIYFGCLIYTHSRDNNMTFEKYSPFFDFLTTVFQQSCEKAEELAEEYAKSPEDDEKSQEYYNVLLLRGSSANLIFQLSYYNPILLDELVEPTIKVFIDMIKIEDLLRFEGSQSFSFRNLKEDFTYIFNIMKYKAIDLVRPYYDEISESENLELLQSILIRFDGQKMPAFLFFYAEFKEILQEYKKEHTFKIEDIQYIFKDIIEPMSKWIYTIPNPAYHLNYLFYVLKFMKQMGPTSFHIFNNCTAILRRVVKPTRMIYNESNKWYKEMCRKLSLGIESYVKNDMDFDPFIYNNSFNGFVNLMEVFVLTKNEYGHTFFGERILKSYENNQISTEYGILNLFSNMIDFDYINEDEYGIMIEIVNKIVERGSPDIDSLPCLFKLITKVSKKNPEIIDTYFQFALFIFEAVKKDKHLLETKIFCTYFILSSYNLNPTNYSSVVELFPELLSIFPVKQLMSPFLDELKAFIEINKDDISKEIVESLIYAFARYLSYQGFASFIFAISDEQHTELVELFKKLISMYLEESHEELPEYLEKILPNQPSSVQYILSLF